MAVRYLYIKEDGSTFGLPPHAAGCFGSILSNESVIFGRREDGVHKLDGVISVRVYNPVELGSYNSPVPNFTDEQVRSMREMMDTHPAVFEPVTLTPEYYEVRTNIPADQFWFCINNLRFAYRNESGNSPLYGLLKATLGVWRATMLFNSFVFSKEVFATKFKMNRGNTESNTSMFPGDEATASLICKMLLDPMELLGKMPPVQELDGMSMYPRNYGGDYSVRAPFYMNTYFLVGDNGKRLTFSEVVKEMCLSDKELSELSEFVII